MIYFELFFSHDLCATSLFFNLTTFPMIRFASTSWRSDTVINCVMILSACEGRRVTLSSVGGWDCNICADYGGRWQQERVCVLWTGRTGQCDGPAGGEGDRLIIIIIITAHTRTHTHTHTQLDPDTVILLQCDMCVYKLKTNVTVLIVLLNFSGTEKVRVSLVCVCVCVCLCVIGCIYSCYVAIKSAHFKHVCYHQCWICAETLRPTVILSALAQGQWMTEQWEWLICEHCVCVCVCVCV